MKQKNSKQQQKSYNPKYNHRGDDQPHPRNIGSMQDHINDYNQKRMIAMNDADQRSLSLNSKAQNVIDKQRL